LKIIGDWGCPTLASYLFKNLEKLYEKKMNIQGTNILKLQYSAQGFREAFLILFDNENKNQWSNHGDALSPIATNGLFSLELYLKLLNVYASYDEINDFGYHLCSHKFKNLYDELGKTDKTFIDDLEKNYQKLIFKNNFPTLNDFLMSIDDYYQQWRYSYTSDELRLYVNTLSDVLNILNDYATQKWLKISNKIGKPYIFNKNDSTIKKDNQSIVIDDFNSIKSN
jgi:hypothetical protein